MHMNMSIRQKGRSKTCPTRQEGHTAHRSESEALQMVEAALELYARACGWGDGSSGIMRNPWGPHGSPWIPMDPQGMVAKEP